MQNKCDYIFKTYHVSSTVSPKIVRRMQIDGSFDLNDIVSLVFLMCGDNQIRQTYEYLTRLKCDSTVDLYDLLSLFPHWEKKLIESLTLIDNKKALLSMKIRAEDAKHNVSLTNYVSRSKAILFKIADKLNKKDTKDLIETLINLGAPTPRNHVNFLELHLMFWHNENFIDINHIAQLGIIASGLLRLGKTDLALTIHRFNDSCSLIDGDLDIGTYPIKNEENVGLCVIVNQAIYGGLETDRASSLVDVEKLVAVLTGLNFIVDVKQNVPSSEFCEEIKRSVKNHFEKETHSIFMLIVMAHGDEGRVLCPEFGEEKQDEMTSLGTVTVAAVQNCLFELEILESRPKILIMNACRGRKAFCTKRYFHDEYTTDEAGKTPHQLVARTDIVTCYSSLPQYISIRDSKKGALFINVFCDLLDKNSDMEICEMFTLINARLMQPTASLSLAFEVGRRGHSAGLANPFDFTSRLTRKLYLKNPSQS